MILYNKIFIFCPDSCNFTYSNLDRKGVKYIKYNFHDQDEFNTPPLYSFADCDVVFFKKETKLLDLIPHFKKHYPYSFYLSYFSRDYPIHKNRAIFYNTSKKKKNLIDSFLLRFPVQKYNIPNKIDISEMNSEDSGFFEDEESFENLFPFESV
tara:strand:- start:685 stop:1143 length:459 start_codon:yes stop_codon:yes gene_type:complete